MTRLLAGLMVAACFCLPVARAQPATGANQIAAQAPFLAAALSEFFSDTRAFTGGVELTLAAPAGSESIKVPFGIGMADGKMRWELNLADVKNADLTPEAVASLKQMGLDRVAFLYLPGKPLTLIVPGMKAYVEVAMPAATAVQQQAQQKVGRLEKREIGRETIAGQPTIKYAVKVPGDDGSATLWQATNLQNLPVKMAITKEKQTYQFQLSNVRLGAPDPRYFEPPVGMTKAADLNAVIQAAAMRSLSGVVGGLK